MNNTAAKTMLNKVPQITLAFWLIKIMSTTVGETAADYLAFNVGFGMLLTTALMSGLLLGALLLQMTTKQMIAWRYWLVVVLVSIVGTLITDIMTDKMDIPLAYSTAGFTLLLIASLALWYKLEGTISIQAVDTRRRELLYWLAILVTFALGTAAGDYATEDMGLGFSMGILIFSGLIALVGSAYYAKRVSSVTCFWSGYVLTRPLGASLGDFLTQRQAAGGLGFDTATISLVFFAAIILLIAYGQMASKKGAGFNKRHAVIKAFLVLAIMAGTPAGWAGYLQLTGNIHTVEEGKLYRSAQLNHEDILELIDEKGIRTVINLRGENIDADWYNREIAAVKAAGAGHYDVRMSADEQPDAETVNQLVELLRTTPRPILIHCQGGADRSGFASALYEYAIAGKPEHEAEKQLSFRYGHFPWLGSSSYAMDQAFSDYASKHSGTPAQVSMD